MKYNELKARLEKLSEEQLNQDVTVYFEGSAEFLPVQECIFATEDDDVLDANHMFLKVMQ